MKLNVGAGDFHLEGYTSIDIRPEVNPDICGNVLDLHFEEGMIEEIYASHVLEHNDKNEIELILRKFYKWLKPQGKLFVVVPNLTIICKMIAEGDEDEILWAWLYGCHNLSEAHGHKWGFTENLLRKELEKAGFKVIGYFESKGGDANFRRNGQLLSLNLECVKE